MIKHITVRYSIQCKNTLEFNYVIKEDHLINLMAVSDSPNKDGWFVWYILWLVTDRGETFNPAITTAYVSLLTGELLIGIDKINEELCVVDFTDRIHIKINSC